MAALIVSNDAETVPQRQDLVKPHPSAATETVQQHDGRTIAGSADRHGKVANLDSLDAACRAH
jgi:hypothetical protein